MQTSRSPRPPHAEADHRHGSSQLHILHHSPGELPPVHARDLAAAWDAARHAALHAQPGTIRHFRFENADGTTTTLALHDPDAACWTAANAHTLRTPYGVSLCLRLLALVDLLARAPTLHTHMDIRHGAADLHPALLRVAAAIPLTNEAGFDETRFRSLLSRAFPHSGACP